MLFPSPLGVFSILTSLIDKNLKVSDLARFRLLSEFSLFLRYTEKRQADGKFQFPSPLGVFSILTYKEGDNFQTLYGFRLLSEFSLFLQIIDCTGNIEGR